MAAGNSKSTTLTHTSFLPCCTATQPPPHPCRYDVELYQQIEALIGLKMEAYPSEQEAVLLLSERVGEAQRIATMQVGAGCGWGWG